MTLLFSDGWVGSTTGISADYRSMAGTILQYDGFVPSAGGASNGIVDLNTAGFSLTFFQGTIPTLAAMNTFLVNSRTSDALLQFSAAAAGSITKATGSKTVTINFGSNLGTILAPGTITWFNIGNTSTTVSNRCQFFGTVGLTGSGADLIMPKTTIVAGDLWLCTNLWFNVGTYHAPI